MKTGYDEGYMKEDYDFFGTSAKANPTVSNR